MLAIKIDSLIKWTIKKVNQYICKIFAHRCGVYVSVKSSVHRRKSSELWRNIKSGVSSKIKGASWNS